MEEIKKIVIDKLNSLKLPEPFQIQNSNETDLLIYFKNTKVERPGKITETTINNSFQGYLLLDPEDKIGYYHEELIESGEGVNPNNLGDTISFGYFQNKTIDYNGLENTEGIEYETVRNLIFSVLENEGWKVELVYSKGEAIYKRLDMSQIQLALRKTGVRMLPILICGAVLGGFVFDLVDEARRGQMLGIIIIVLVIAALSFLINYTRKVN